MIKGLRNYYVDITLGLSITNNWDKKMNSTIKKALIKRLNDSGICQKSKDIIKSELLAAGVKVVKLTTNLLASNTTKWVFGCIENELKGSYDIFIGRSFTRRCHKRNLKVDYYFPSSYWEFIK